MKLFRKKEEVYNKSESVIGADLKVLGTGCTKCIELSNNAKQALSELGKQVEVEKVMSAVDIASYGVMSTPALVYKGKVISYGKVLTVEQIKKLL